MLWPVCLGVKHPSVAQDEIFVPVKQLLVCWCEVSSHERTSLSFANVTDPHQCSHSQVPVWKDSHFNISDSRPPTWRARSPYLYHPDDSAVKLLLAFAISIPSFSLPEIQDKVLFSSRHVYVSRWGLITDKVGHQPFYGDAMFAAQYCQQEYINAVFVSRSLWTLCILCHWTMLSNIYTRYTVSSWRYVDGWGTMLQTGRPRVPVLIK
jgi:hypothetical protein